MGERPHKRLRGLAVPVALALLVTGGSGYAWYRNASAADAARGVRVGRPLVDLADPSAVAGLADNIFIARVERETGREADLDIPQRQYRARVLEQLKGDLPDVVTLTELVFAPDADAQRGGTVGDYSGEPLQPGAAYLLITRTREVRQWEVVTAHPEVRVRIESEGQKAQLRGKWQTAVATQKPFGKPQGQ